MQITLEQFEAAKAQKAAAEDIITLYYRQASDRADARWRDGPPFTDGELVYAATCRCACGQGMAYPKEIGSARQWTCSAKLKGTANEAEPHDVLPFAIYEIKSEQQPSAFGQTTRPA